MFSILIHIAASSIDAFSFLDRNDDIAISIKRVIATINTKGSKKRSKKRSETGKQSR